MASLFESADEKTFLKSSPVSDIQIFWGENSRSNEGCIVKWKVSGLLKGTTTVKNFRGSIHSFRRNEGDASFWTWGLDDSHWR